MTSGCTFIYLPSMYKVVNFVNNHLPIYCVLYFILALEASEASLYVIFCSLDRPSLAQCLHFLLPFSITILTFEVYFIAEF